MANPGVNSFLFTISLHFNSINFFYFITFRVYLFFFFFFSKSKLMYLTQSSVILFELVCFKFQTEFTMYMYTCTYMYMYKTTFVLCYICNTRLHFSVFSKAIHLFVMHMIMTIYIQIFCTIFTPSIQTPYSLHVLVLKCEKVLHYLWVCPKNCWMSGKQCRP